MGEKAPIGEEPYPAHVDLGRSARSLFTKFASDRLGGLVAPAGEEGGTWSPRPEVYEETGYGNPGDQATDDPPTHASD